MRAPSPFMSLYLSNSSAGDYNFFLFLVFASLPKVVGFWVSSL